MKKIKLIDGTILYIPRGRISGVILDNDNNRIFIICGEQRLPVSMADIEDKEQYAEDLFN